MSAIYPAHLATTGDVMVSDEQTQVLGEVAAELDGNLGEQNWAASAFQIGDMAVDAVLRIVATEQSVNWTTLNADNEPVAGPTDSLRLDVSVAWQTVVAFALATCRGGDYECVASFQYDFGAVSSTSTYWSEHGGVQWAWRVDGTVAQETIVGGVERANDPNGESVFVDIAGELLEGQFHLTPGTHKIELVARLCRPSANSKGPSSTTYVEVFNREIWIEEAH